MSDAQTWVTVVVSVLTTLGGKELVLFIVKNKAKRAAERQAKRDEEISSKENQLIDAKAREDMLIVENMAILKELLAEVKAELEVKRQIENELREKYSDCKARLELFIKQLTDESKEKRV